MYSIPELRQRVEEEIRKISISKDPAALYDPIRYILSLEGKRMRPVLVLLGCELFGGDITEAVSPALGIEVFHNFTLLHDDIMDNAPLRRGNATVHAKWNNNVAILSGDTMFVMACQLMMKSPDRCVRSVMELYHRTAIEVCEGQQWDMDFETSNKVTIPDYLEMISLKTAVLLAASLQTGAIIAGAGNEDARHLYEFGRCIGVAFQLQDDILDAFGDAGKVGKRTGGDIIANKKTYLLLKAIELANDHQKMAIQNLLMQTDKPEEKVAEMLEIFESLNIRTLAREAMDRYYTEAMGHLDAVKVDDDRKTTIRNFAKKLMDRES